MAYYRKGAKVQYTPTGHNATVIDVLPNDEYLVEFDGSIAIPPQMKVKEYTLIPQLQTFHVFGQLGLNEQGEAQIVPRIETHCPRCGRLWKKTVGFTTTFYDCISCDLKREDV